MNVKAILNNLDISHKVIPSINFETGGLHYDWMPEDHHLYTVVLIDVNAPASKMSGKETTNYLHYLAVNSNGETQDVIVNYQPPNPPSTNHHQYYILIYQQKKEINPETIHIKKRHGFNLNKFVKNHNLKLVGEDYFYSYHSTHVK